MTDISEAPTNYHEWYGRIKDAEAEFNKLPIEVKNKWDNDVEKYIPSGAATQNVAIVSPLNDAGDAVQMEEKTT